MSPKCKLTPAQLAELERALDVGPAVWGWDEDQCWTLARVADLVRRRFRVEYTLAGVDLLLHRIGWSVQVPARLLDAAHQQLSGPLVLVWDNLNTHVSRAMSELVAAREWLTVFQLPTYASELNPVESVWSHLKRSLGNLAKRDIAQLTALVKTRLRRMQYQPGLIEGFLAGTRLDLTPFCNFRT